jgi:hypothetical protein
MMRGTTPALKDLDVYETRGVLFVTGYDVQRGGYRVLEILRPSSHGGSLPALGLVEERGTLFTHKQLNEHLKTRGVNLSSRVVSGAYCIYGIVRLLESYYLIVVTNAETVATLHGHSIYAIRDTFMIPVTYKARKTMEETRYKSMLTNTDFSSGYYFFSYTHVYSVRWLLWSVGS